MPEVHGQAETLAMTAQVLIELAPLPTDPAGVGLRQKSQGQKLASELSLASPEPDPAQTTRRRGQVNGAERRLHVTIKGMPFSKLPPQLSAGDGEAFLGRSLMSSESSIQPLVSLPIQAALFAFAAVKFGLLAMLGARIASQSRQLHFLECPTIHVFLQDYLLFAASPRLIFPIAW
jgi:hypothetical protein